MKRFLQKAARPASILSALAGSVCRRVAVAVFVTVIVLDAIVIVPVYLRERHEFVDERAAEALSLLSSAVDPSRYPSIESLTEMGQNLTRITKIDGGVVISGAGEERSVFGDPPALSWADARLNGQTFRFTSGTGVFDVFLSPEDTKLPYGVILRLDAARDWQALTEQITFWVILSFLVAVIVSAATALTVAREVVRPLATIREAVDFTLNHPEDSEAIRTGVSRGDEIGSLARAVDQLLFLTSATFADELAAAVSILETSPHGILTFSEQGHLMSANAAALRLFGETTFSGLLQRDPRSLFRFDDRPVNGAELAARGRVVGPGEVVSKGGDFPCLVAGDTVKRADGSPLRRFLMFVDMRDLVEQVKSEVHRREAAEKEALRRSRDLRLLRQLFDACLVVTALDGGGVSSANAVTVIPAELIEAWRRRVEQDGQAVGELDVSDLPPVVGDPAELRRLFDTAMEVVRLRSRSEMPRIAVSGKAMQGRAIFVIRETDAAGADTAISTSTDLTLMIGALGVFCKRQNGALAAPADAGDANRLSFRLNVDEAGTAPPPDSKAA